MNKPLASNPWATEPKRKRADKIRTARKRKKKEDNMLGRRLGQIWTSHGKLSEGKSYD